MQRTFSSGLLKQAAVSKPRTHRCCTVFGRVGMGLREGIWTRKEALDVAPPDGGAPGEDADGRLWTLPHPRDATCYWPAG